MTNYERIKNMSKKEVAEELYANAYDCGSCPADSKEYTECCEGGNDCVKTIMKWLEEESD